MGNTFKNELNMISEEFPGFYNLNNSDRVFSVFKNIVKEPKQLTTNKSLKIIKNEFETKILVLKKFMHKASISISYLFR